MRAAIWLPVYGILLMCVGHLSKPSKSALKNGVPQSDESECELLPFIILNKYNISIRGRIQFFTIIASKGGENAVE